MPATMPSAANRAGPSPSLGTCAGFGAMRLGMFMAVLDIQVVATSLPTIQAALDMRPDQTSWIETSHLIAEADAIPLTGVLTRALGMRWLSVTLLAVFTAASIGCAYSQSFAALLVWRVVPGLRGRATETSVFAGGLFSFQVAARLLPRP